MPPSPDLADWRMTLAFIAAMAVLILCLKIASALRHTPPPGFWLTLLPSVASFRRVKPASASAVRRILARFVGASLGFGAYWLAYWSVVNAVNLSGIWLGWMGTPLVWLMGEVLSSMTELVCLLFKLQIPPVHHEVFRSRGVGDFWGRHWNVWMSDWFRATVFLPLRKRPVVALVIVFTLSGIIHELVLNFSLWLVTDRNLFGSMMLYFTAQAAGVLFERAWLTNYPRLRRAFAWLVVVGPAPWIVNEGLLRALHLWP